MSQLTIQMIPDINNENFTFNPNYIQPDPQILTGVHEGDSFSKKKATTKKTPEQSLFHFPMTGAAMVQLASSDK